MPIRKLWWTPKPTNRGTGTTVDTLSVQNLIVKGIFNVTGLFNLVNLTISNFLTTLFLRVGGRIENTRVIDQGIHLGWNDSGIDGAGQIVNKCGLGSGGVVFYNSTGSGSAFSVGKQEMMRITPTQLTVNGYVRRSVPVMARRRTIGTLVAPSVNTVVEYTTSDDFNFNSADTGLSYNTGVFTNTSGEARVYMVHYSVGFAHSTQGNQRIAWIQHNGFDNNRRYAQCAVPPTLAVPAGTICEATGVIRLLNNDSFTIWCWHDGVGNLGIGNSEQGNNNATRIVITLL